jgi:DNA-binding NarL/FixJ family response regulator
LPGGPAIIRILLVDDNPDIRQGFRELLELEGEFLVVGEAANGREAIPLVTRHWPDVVVLDLFMPLMDGYQFLLETGKMHRPVRTLVVTVLDDEASTGRAFAAGCRGFLRKHAAHTLLPEAIRAVHRGELYLDPSLEQSLGASFPASFSGEGL